MEALQLESAGSSCTDDDTESEVHSCDDDFMFDNDKFLPPLVNIKLDFPDDELMDNLLDTYFDIKSRYQKKMFHTPWFNHYWHHHYHKFYPFLYLHFVKKCYFRYRYLYPFFYIDFFREVSRIVLMIIQCKNVTYHRFTRHHVILVYYYHVFDLTLTTKFLLTP